MSKPVTNSDISVPSSDKPVTYSVSVANYRAGADIAALMLQGLSHTDADSANQRIEWIYRVNPAGPAVTAIVTHIPTQRSVGLLALCRRQVWTPVGIVNAGILCDFVAEKSHRTLGPAIMLMEEALTSARAMDLDRIYGWPNPKSIVLFSRFKSAKRDKIRIYRRYLDWPDKLSDKIPRPVALLLGNVLNVLDNGYQRLWQLWGNRHFVARHPETFDSDIDDLWQQARERYDEIGVRDARFLRWRFLQSTDCDHRLFSMVSRQDNKTVGYVVYRELDAECVEISDFLALDSRGTERSLLSFFCRFMSESGYKKVSVCFTGNHQTRRNLWMSGFIDVGSQAVIHFQLDAKPPPTPETLSHVTQADHDVG